MTVLGLFFNPEIRTGGHRRFLELMAGLARQGVQVMMATGANPPAEPDGVTVIRCNVPPRRHRLDLASRRYLGVVHDLESRLPARPDCMLVFGESHFPAANRLSRRLRIPLIYGQRSNMVQESRMALSDPEVPLAAKLQEIPRLLSARRYERAIARNGTVVVVQSPADARDMQSRLPLRFHKKFRIIRGNTLEPRFLTRTRAANHSQSCRKVLFVGTTGFRKGLTVLMKAVAHARTSGAGIELHVIALGPGELRFQSLADELGMADSFRWHGRQDCPQDFMAEMDLLVVPSWFDSYPNTVLEGIHAGIPVLGSRTGGIPDQLEHGELLFVPGDWKDLGDRLCRLAADASLYLHVRALCESRRSFFEFDWSKAWYDMLAEILPPGSPP